MMKDDLSNITLSKILRRQSMEPPPKEKVIKRGTQIITQRDLTPEEIEEKKLQREGRATLTRRMTGKSIASRLRYPFP